jgi:hypothetical protein
MKMAIIVLLFSLAAIAVEPNFVKITTYGVGTNSLGVSQDMVTTEYSDGLGKNIQSKVSLSSTKDRVSCTFYDNAGRQKYVTKPFVDATSVGSYLEGDSATINSDGGVLQQQYPISAVGYPNHRFAFSSVDYYDDPLNRVKESGTPGAGTRAGQGHSTKVWYFGVGLDGRYFFSNETYIFEATFSNGFIESFSPQNEITLDSLYSKITGYEMFSSPEYLLTVTKNPDGHYSQELKDKFGNIIATRTTQSSNQTDSVIAHYSYDILGNVLSETPPTNNSTKLINSTTYKYNVLGQLIKKITPDAGVNKYAYYEDGQLQSDTTKNMAEDAIYRILTYTYDFLSRLTLISYNQPQTGITNATVIKNYYDDLSGFVSENIIEIPESYYTYTDTTNLKGRLVADVAYNINLNNISAAVVDLYSYDDEGRLYKKYKKIPGMQIQESTYSYDLQGKIDTQTFVYNNQDKIVKIFNYDELGRLKNIIHQNNDNKELVNYSYNDIGQLTSKTIPPISSDYTQTYGYSIRDQLFYIFPPTDKKGFYENISSYSYAGNILDAQYKYKGVTTADYELLYTYDYLNRLTTVTPSESEYSEDYTNYAASYSYDPAGRITNKTEGSSALTGYQYYNNGSQYTSRLQKTSKNGTAKDYIYDVFGNLVVDLTKNMYIEYDYRNLPVAFRFYSNLSTIVSGTTTSSTGTADDNLFTNIKNSGAMVSQVVMYYDASGNRVAKLESK